MMLNCKRCKKKQWNFRYCNYCGNIVCIKCTKASKHISNRTVYRINICKDCFGKSDMRKLYKRNEYLLTLENID